MTLLRKKRPVWVGLSGGLPIPAASVAPAIDADSVIGTEHAGDDGTWNLEGLTYTYQWQRNTGSWVIIAGATSQDYTPVDADFGYALRLEVTGTNAAGVATTVYSNTTNLVKESPTQTTTVLCLNPGFDADANWIKGANWSIGGGVATKTASASQSVIGQDVAEAAAGLVYEIPFTVTAVSAGEVRARIGNAVYVPFATATGSYVGMAQKSDTAQRLGVQGTEAFAGSVDNVPGSRININSQLAAPTANMTITAFYTLPASPLGGSRYWVFVRVSDFAAGNYFAAELYYTGSQWNITLYSVASFTRTATAAAATNIGATNGIKLTCNGNLIDLSTTANGGTNWTARGSQVNSALYNTAVGVNVVASSDFTLGLLEYAGAA